MKGTATAVEPRLFTYHRMSPALTDQGLAALGLGHVAARSVAPIDATEQVPALSEIGRRYAEGVVEGMWRNLL